MFPVNAMIFIIGLGFIASSRLNLKKKLCLTDTELHEISAVKIEASLNIKKENALENVVCHKQQCLFI